MSKRKKITFCFEKQLNIKDDELMTVFSMNDKKVESFKFINHDGIYFLTLKYDNKINESELFTRKRNGVYGICLRDYFYAMGNPVKIIKEKEIKLYIKRNETKKKKEKKINENIKNKMEIETETNIAFSLNVSEIYKKVKIKKCENRNKNRKKNRKKIEKKMQKMEKTGNINNIEIIEQRIDDDIVKIFNFFESFKSIPSMNFFREILLTKYEFIDTFKVLSTKLESILGRIKYKRKIKKEFFFKNIKNIKNKKNEKKEKKNFTNTEKKLIINVKNFEDKYLKKIEEEKDKKNDYYKIIKNLPKIENFFSLIKINDSNELFLKKLMIYDEEKNKSKKNSYIKGEKIKQTYFNCKFMFLYYSKETLDSISLKKYHHVYIDGSRGLGKVYGMQLVTVTIKKEGGCGKQVIFCLTNKFCQKTYQKMFEETKFFWNKNKNLIFHADFESALHKVSEVCDFSKFVPCYFHYLKILIDKIRDLNLIKMVSSYNPVYNLLRLVYFCNKANLAMFFLFCKSKITNSGEQKIIDYICKHFSENGKYSDYVKNEFTGETTTNSAEWFHKQLKARLATTGGNLFDVIEKMKISIKEGFLRNEKKITTSKNKNSRLKDVANFLYEDHSKMIKCDFFKKIEEIVGNHEYNLNTIEKRNKIRM